MILLLATVVGIPIGLTVLAVYSVSLLLGYLSAAVFVGDVGARLLRQGMELTTGQRMLSLVLALVLLALGHLLPVVGGILLFLALVCGLGAWGRQVYRSYAG